MENELKASDLRIGNLINSKLLGTNHLVQGLIVRNGKEHLYTDLQESYSDFEDWQPIPLSEQWLLDFNFYKDNYGIYERTKDNTPYVSGCEIEFWIKQCTVDGKKVWDLCIGKTLDKLTHLTYIEFVHELQNIFYSLKKEELNSLSQ